MIEMKQDQRFHKALHEFTVQSARDYIERHCIDLDAIKFLIVSQPEKGFAERIYHAIGLNGTTSMVDLYNRYGNPHSSTLPLAFHTLVEQGCLKEKDNVLFVATGSGLTTAFAMYSV